MKKSRTVSSNIPKLSLPISPNYLSLLTNPNIFLQEYSIQATDLNRSLCVCMANGTDSEEFVLLSRVWTGHKREFAFVMKAQSEICGSLGRTRSRKTRNEALATNRSKKLRKSDPRDAENDKVMDQKAKDLGDLADSMSEEEAKSDVVDLTSDDEPKGHVGESESVGEGDSKKDTSMPVFDEELEGGVVEMVQNPVKEEELVCESKPNVNEEMKAEPGVGIWLRMRRLRGLA